MTQKTTPQERIRGMGLLFVCLMTLGMGHSLFFAIFPPLARDLGLKTHIYCPEADCPAAQVSSAFTAAAYDDEAALSAFAAAVDVVTYEFENIPVATVAHIAAIKNVFPSAKTLKIAQDRFEEKSFMRMQGFGVADFFDITDLAVSCSAAGNSAGRVELCKI